MTSSDFGVMRGTSQFSGPLAPTILKSTVSRLQHRDLNAGIMAVTGVNSLHTVISLGINVRNLVGPASVTVLNVEPIFSNNGEELSRIGRKVFKTTATQKQSMERKGSTACAL